ncbi:MAG: hypothetical protein ACW964_11930 [Candidatus Hodarchaeales archaeon]
MASQYLTFMIVFTLGLAMVIATNTMFNSMSEQFRLNIADYEMDNILEEVEIQILQNMLFPTDSNLTIEQNIEMPVNLAQSFGYTIDISNSSENSIILHGVTLNKRINQNRIFSLGSVYSIEVEGNFKSTSTILTLRIEKLGTEISIQIS